MLLKKSKYIFVLLQIFFIIFPTICFALDEESIYVWSNNSNTISTSISPSKEKQEQNEQNER